VAKFYEGLRFVYEIRSRLSELAAEEDDTAAQTPQGTKKK
jgi:hypothetical protein